MKQALAFFCVATVGMLSACEAGRPEAPPEAAQEQTYGQLTQPNAQVVALAEIAADPARYEGRQVQTEGEIQQVCQKRGCWLELADAAGTRAFVPMAGHTFAIPMDSIGSKALVEGIVHRRERTDSEREHLEADGAGPSIPALSIEANAVVIR